MTDVPFAAVSVPREGRPRHDDEAGAARCAAPGQLCSGSLRTCSDATLS